MEGLNRKNGKISQKWLSKRGLKEEDKMRPNWSLKGIFFSLWKGELGLPCKRREEKRREKKEEKRRRRRKKKEVFARDIRYGTLYSFV